MLSKNALTRPETMAKNPIPLPETDAQLQLQDIIQPIEVVKCRFTALRTEPSMHDSRFNAMSTFDQLRPLLPQAPRRFWPHPAEPRSWAMHKSGAVTYHVRNQVHEAVDEEGPPHLPPKVLIPFLIRTRPMPSRNGSESLLPNFPSPWPILRHAADTSTWRLQTVLPSLLYGVDHQAPLASHEDEARRSAASISRWWTSKGQKKRTAQWSGPLSLSWSDPFFEGVHRMVEDWPYYPQTHREKRQLNTPSRRFSRILSRVAKALTLALWALPVKTVSRRNYGSFPALWTNLSKILETFAPTSLSLLTIYTVAFLIHAVNTCFVKFFTIINCFEVNEFDNNIR